MLSSQQLTLLRADILADPVLSAIANTPDGAFQIAAAYNAPKNPAFVVWRTLVSEYEITRNTSPEATNWSWPAYIARSEAERSGWARMFNSSYTVNPSLPSVRQGFLDIFSGSQNNAPAQRAHLAAICKRNATRAEALFAIGAGSTPSPGTMTFEGAISYEDVLAARA